jgi:putative hydrolase of the HAD superfamily
MIEAVTFDVWETMVMDSAPVSEARCALRVQRIASVLRETGHGVSEDEVRAAYDRSWPSFEAIWVTGREVPPREQIAMLIADIDGGMVGRLDAPVWAALEDAYVQPIFDEPPRPNDGLAEVLEALRVRRIHLGLVCNTGRTPGYAMRRLLGDYGVLGYFEALAFSDEQGIRKPNPEIFRRVLLDLGVSSGKAVHLGDNIAADIGGAKGAGMRAVLIRGTYHGDAVVAPDGHITGLNQLLEAIRLL